MADKIKLELTEDEVGILVDALEADMEGYVEAAKEARANNKRDECQEEHRWKQLTRAVVHRTGSHPPALSGEQRAIRRAPIQLPLRTPYFMIASSVYREQLGSNRQLDGSHAKRIR
mgnify:CR=1 FL=1